MSLIVPQLKVEATPRFDYASGICSGGCMDVDALWERHGHFLLIENKHPGEDIPRGALITLRRLKEMQEFTVWVVYGYPRDDIRSFGPLDEEQRPADVFELRQAIQEWWDVASQTPLPWYSV